MSQPRANFDTSLRKLAFVAGACLCAVHYHGVGANRLNAIGGDG